MSQTELENSFLTTGLPTDQSTPDLDAVESPELDFSAVESPSVDSPGLFEYEGPFGDFTRPDDDLWFEIRRKARRDQRLFERRQVMDFYENFNFEEDGSIKFKDGGTFDFDFDLDIDLRELGFKLPEWNPKLKLEDAIPRLNFGYLLEKDMIPKFDTPESVKEFFEGVTSGLDNLIGGIDLTNLESFKDNFDGYGSAGKSAYDAISQTLNFYENPSLTNAEGLLNSLNKASETFEKIGFQSGSDLAKLSPNLSGLLLDAGAVSDIASFVDDPSLKSAAQAYGSMNFLLENYTDLGSIPGSQSDIAKLAGNAVTVINAATQLDDFFKDPTLSGALTTSAAVANAAAVFGSTSTAATATSIANFLNPITAFVAGVGLIRGLTHDADYTRSDGIVSYGNGKFSTTSLNGADGGPLAFKHWADAHTSTAVTGLNSLINDYGFTVDEKKMATIFNSHMNKSYITNNPQYARQGGRNHSSSNVDMVLSLLKAGALKPGEDTPLVLVQDEGTFGSFMGSFFRQMTNDAATYMMDNGGFVSQQYRRGAGQQRKIESRTYLPFADKQSAQAYIDTRGIGLKKSGMQEIGSRRVYKTRSIPILGFNVTGHTINSDNSIKPTTLTYNVGEGTVKYRGKYTPQYTRTFKTEAQAKAFVSANSGDVVEKYTRQEGRYKERTDYAYILHEGKYLIGSRTVKI